MDLGIRFENRSENARHIILSHSGKVYYVGRVQVHFSKGKGKHQAVFYAKEVGKESMQGLDMEIPHKLYETLVEYTKLDSSDLILVLHVEANNFKWGFTSENWLKQYAGRCNVSKYVV